MQDDKGLEKMDDNWQSIVLTTADTDWDKYINNTKISDIFYTSKYMRLFENFLKEKAYLYVFGNNEEFVAYPFFRRDVSVLPFYNLTGNGNQIWYDITSPWYYGGHLVHGGSDTNTNLLYREFFKNFKIFCKNKNIICEVARLHPFIGDYNRLKSFANIKKVGEVVYIDLNQSNEEIWRNMAKSNRNKIKKSLSNGVEVIAVDSKEALRPFFKIYIELMNTKQAKGFYKFPIDFFQELFELFKDNAELLVAKFENKIIAGLILMGERPFLHTYLSASDPDYLYLAPNNILKYYGALRAKENGFSYYVLGGGYRPNDGLYKFKKSFSNTTIDYYIYYKIFNYKIYNDLCSKRSQYDKLQNMNNSADCFFFPEYRR